MTERPDESGAWDWSMFGFAAAPHEPDADQRAGALQLRGFFDSMVAAGFSEEQAVYLVGQSLHGAAMGHGFAQGTGGGS